MKMTWKRCRSLTCLLLLAQVTRADEVKKVAGIPISGRVFTDIFVPTNALLNGNLTQTSTSFWLQSDPRLGEHAFGHFIFTADDITASSATGLSLFQPQLRETFIDYSKNGWGFRAGKVIFRWGQSDAVRPTDFLSSMNNIFFNPDPEVKRLGTQAVSVSWTPHEGNSPWTFTTVFIPVFTQSKLLLPPPLIPSNLIISPVIQPPSPTLSNSEEALRATYHGDQWDSSLVVFRGWNHLSELTLTGTSGSSPSITTLTTQTFHPYRAIGADSAVTTGQWTIRAESAYVWTENNDGSNPLTQPSYFDAVLGIVRPFGGDFKLHTQLLLRYYPQYLSPSVVGGLADINALIQNYQNRFRPSGTLQLDYADQNNKIDVNVFFMVSLIDGSYLFQPQLSHAWSSTWKVTTGLSFFGGPTSSPLGVMSFFNSLYLEAKYSF